MSYEYPWLSASFIFDRLVPPSMSWKVKDLGPTMVSLKIGGSGIDSSISSPVQSLNKKELN